MTTDRDLPGIFDEAMREVRTGLSKIALERQADEARQYIGAEKVPKPERLAETRSLLANNAQMQSLAAFYSKRDGVTPEPHPLTGEAKPISRRFVDEMKARWKEMQDADTTA